MRIEASVFTTDAWSRDTMAAELADRHGYYLVAFAPSTPTVIAAYAGLRAPQGAAQADIQTIAVVEGARGGGLGRVLIQQLTNEARRRGADELFLEVRADNPVARRLYDSLGFTHIDVRPRYYQPDDVDAVVMRLVIPEPTTGVAS